MYLSFSFFNKFSIFSKTENSYHLYIQYMLSSCYMLDPFKHQVYCGKSKTSMAPQLTYWEKIIKSVIATNEKDNEGKEDQVVSKRRGDENKTRSC